MWAVEILLRLKEQPEYSEIKLMAFLSRHSEKTVVVGEKGQAPEINYRRRNEYIVDQADCLAVYDNNHSIRSRTGMTVNYAQKKNFPIYLILPDTAKGSLNMI